MRRIKFVVAVLAMSVVMAGSAVPAMAQGRGDDVTYYNFYNPGYENGQVDNYNYNPGYENGQVDNYNYNPDYGYDPYANGLFGPCGLFATYDPYTGACY